MKYGIKEETIGMKKMILILMLFCGGSVFAQTDFQKDYDVRNKKGIVQILSEDLIVIKDAQDESKRYVARNLPNELKKEGLLFVFNAQIGKIPPNYRMAGTPMILSKLTISKKDAKRYYLKKRKYSF